uniref:Uncharacterized protein n=1 Tax=viral metagenome TaxID=1070528 RepID=A0A6H1ZMJ3_9ZZZZ
MKNKTLQELESTKSDRISETERSFPRPADGNDGDQRVISDAGSRYFCFKSDGDWYKIQATKV